jgi:hypothetical protein
LIEQMAEAATRPIFFSAIAGLSCTVLGDIAQVPSAYSDSPAASRAS